MRSSRTAAGEEAFHFSESAGTDKSLERTGRYVFHCKILNETIHKKGLNAQDTCLDNYKCPARLWATQSDNDFVLIWSLKEFLKID